MKKVLALQYWQGDRDAAMLLARFIASLQPEHSPDVDFVFAVRGDAREPDAAVVKRLSKAFNVRFFKTKQVVAGWPAGPWALWFSLVEYLHSYPEPVKWALTFEADCAPLTRTWISELDAEWDRRKSGTRLIGCSPEGGVAHINGNMLMSCDHDFLTWIVREVTIAGVPKPEGWDTWLFPQFLHWGCQVSPKFASFWQTRSAGVGLYKHLRNDGVVFCHGVKDDSLIRQASRALRGTVFFT